MNALIERALQSIDLEAITREVFRKLVIKNLDMYFVVYRLPDCEEYNFVGMAYSKQAAKTLWLENSKKYPCKVLKFDMGKLVTLVEKLGGTEEIL